MGKFSVHLLLSIAAILSYGLVGLPDAAKAQSEPQPAGQTVTVTEPNPVVKPTDWAYITLKLVASKFNCPSTPDLSSTYFISGVEITRYEFAQVLSECLDKVSQLLRTQEITKIITKQDIAAIQKLQEEFEAELSTVGKGLQGIMSPISIQPNEPIYKHLQLIIQEYGCVPETRNSSYDLGNTELKEAEFVEIFNGCLRRVNQLAISGTKQWTRAELEPLAKLESEFYYRRIR
ncbi:MAG: hypothetical protein JGK17_07505 [Microcoleus sp. PH2017_10_PVI_O_A]|uniref:hypothetical protein n=1 Tax=unclassified Microcoleus TaxID=2642155 RepID=UPI001DA87A32|nr:MULTISPECIES: hypothetical protein [unclassified Microcoleus]TAE81295.1 MAG: hypothetical protein EAZ83_15630 [Oscillatoriales cyanobacterium]MCC3405429.1 hypothetical protein [Microcoleus sp. PH2017_10_PVI_O_A]MCC3459422.1 hypothetical protein [Microcoleus sp. PH2017_11_PCY_U_A]MCC3477702.1 hypothetical protein [Microcoleus sp. PH2017_12_PCY_D_A]MCC3527424.1 hypothetical protein [Microcoleus sp. PH2017_21_RUC_O_A]